MPNILLFSSQRIFADDGTARGPGLRTWEMARALKRRKHAVTIAENDHAKNSEPEGIPVIAATWDRLNELTKGYDAAVLPLTTMRDRYFRDAHLPTVVDAYDPVLIETAHRLNPTKEALYEFAAAMQRHATYFQHGDFFLCAGSRQRLFYIGILSQLGRINPLQRSAGDILAEIPTAAPPEKPRSLPYWSKRNIDAILWPGGIYPWFDAQTPIAAMQEVAKSSSAKLIFLGAPCNPSDVGYLGFVEARKQAQEMHLLDKSIFFEPWLPYSQRAKAYSDALFAVISQKQHLETEFSWRTRTIDCLWGGLPVVVNEGDEVGETASAAGAGISVPINDADALASAMLDLLEHPKKRKEMSDAARQLIDTRFNWDVVIEPLDKFCKAPHLAADRIDTRTAVVRGAFRPSRRLKYNYYLQRAFALLREKGISHVIKKARDVV